MPTFSSKDIIGLTVETPDPSESGQVKRPIAGTTLYVWDHATHEPLGTIVAEDYGYVPEVTFDADVILISAVDDVTTGSTVISSESLIAASQAGTIAAQALTAASQAAQSATAASSAAQAAQTAAASALSPSAVGVSVASLDGNGDVPLSQIPDSLLDDVQALKDGSGAATGGGIIELGCEWFGTALAGGQVTFSKRLPTACVANHPPLLQMDDYGATDTVVDVEASTDSGATWSSLYGASKPTIPPNGTSALGSAPTVQSLAAGTLLRGRIVSVPPPASGSGTQAAFGATTVYGAGATTANLNHTFTKPSGSVGDVVIASIACLNQAAGPVQVTATMPAGWTLVDSMAATVSGSPGTYLQVLIYKAEWSSGLSTAVTFSSAVSPIITATVVTGASLSDPGTVYWTPTLAENSGTTVTSPTTTQTYAADAVLLGAAYRLKNGEDGYTLTVTGGPGDLVDAGKAVTNRGTGTGDYGAGVQTSLTDLAANVSPAQVTYGLTGGTPSLSAATWISWALPIKRGVGSHGPSYLTLDLPLEVAP